MTSSPFNTNFLKPAPPFVFSAEEEGVMELRSSRESVYRLAEVVRFWFGPHAGKNHAHLTFPAGHLLAPEFIAACWHAGVPFRMIPENEEDSADVPGTPVPYHWQQALEKWLEAGGEDAQTEKRQIPDDAIFAYIQTSGSSGRPKCAGLTRAQMLSAAKSGGENIRPSNDECWLLCLPLQHIGGISVVLRSWFYGSCVMDARNVRAETIADQLRLNASVTVASFVPTQLKRLVESDRKPFVHDKFKAVLLGGGPSSAGLIERCRADEIPVIKSYGMTETCAQVAAVAFAAINTAPPAASGKLFSGHRISIREESGAEVEGGKSGLIWLKGPQVITSYIPAETRHDSFDDESFFCTGDYGFLDEQGYLHIEMRRSDLIVSGGENINPTEIEEALRRIWPEFVDVAVGGVPDEEWGQLVAAFIVPGKNRPDEHEIREKLRENLPAFKLPRKIVFVKSLPRNAMGKLQRHLLKG